MVILHDEDEAGGKESWLDCLGRMFGVESWRGSHLVCCDLFWLCRRVFGTEFRTTCRRVSPLLYGLAVDSGDDGLDDGVVAAI